MRNVGLMSARILVVDDEELVIWSYLRIFGGGDYHVEAAHGGREALRKVQENSFDVIILDLKMPDIDGLEICAVSRRRTQRWTSSSSLACLRITS